MTVVSWIGMQCQTVTLLANLEEFSLMLVLWKEGALALFLLSFQLLWLL